MTAERLGGRAPRSDGWRAAEAMETHEASGCVTRMARRPGAWHGRRCRIPGPVEPPRRERCRRLIPAMLCHRAHQIRRSRLCITRARCTFTVFSARPSPPAPVQHPRHHRPPHLAFPQGQPDQRRGEIRRPGATAVTASQSTIAAGATHCQGSGEGCQARTGSSAKAAGSGHAHRRHKRRQGSSVLPFVCPRARSCGR